MGVFPWVHEVGMYTAGSPFDICTLAAVRGHSSGN